MVINELLAHTDPPLADFVELYNPDPLPVALGGLCLSDQPAGQPDRGGRRPTRRLQAHLGRGSCQTPAIPIGIHA